MHFPAGPELSISLADTFQFLRKQLATHKHIHVFVRLETPKNKNKKLGRTYGCIFLRGPELSIRLVDTFQFLRKQLAEHEHIHVFVRLEAPKNKNKKMGRNYGCIFLRGPS